MSYASLDDVYNNSPLSHVNKQEAGRAAQIYQDARRPDLTGVIAGHGFQQQIINETDMGDPRNHINYAAQPGTIVSELTGKPIAREAFHNNQVPFIGRGVMQNTNAHAYDTLLSKYTGNGDVAHREKKMEVASFADVRANSGNWVNGTPALTRYGLENRYYASRFRQGEKPFQDMKVGPALNAGFGTEGQGGVQQANSLDFARAQANRIINNRLPNNPKISYTPLVTPGALPGGVRGVQAAVTKHKPERWYRNEPERYFITGGAIKAQTLREKVIAKATKRQNHRAYYGGLGTSGITKPTKDPGVRKSRRNNFMADSIRNAFRGDGWTVSDSANEQGVGDYGLKSIENKPNERDVTQKREQRLNLTSNVKKLITPVVDVIRRTRKENFIGNIRPDGNMKAQIPSKLTVHDPNDVARTTVKETTEDNSHIGFMKGRTALTVYDPNDVARTTIKETTEENAHSGFLKGPVSNTVKDPEDVARTTLKELNIHNTAPYINCKPQQPTSLRVYDPDDVARTTLKEMTEDANHMGFVQYRDGLHAGAYTSTRVDMRPTHKQFNTNYYYTGVPSAEVGKGGGRGYLAARYKAKNTIKQFLSDYEYSGGAGFYQPKQVSYSSAYNAHLNPNKETISQGRAPTEVREKLTAGGDMVNLAYNRKIEADRVNIREPAETFVFQAPPQKNMCGMTTVKQNLPEDVQRSRLDPDLLNAYRENPYTQSLSSAA